MSAAADKPCALIMAGGTGGHVFPALAVAKVLQQRGWHVEWLGTEKGIEARVVPQHGIVLNTIEAVGLRGKQLKSLLVAPWHLLRALLQSLSVLRRLRPRVVLGMGGFAAAPGGVCALLLRVPLVIHEQNAVAGTTNRLLARLAARVLAAFPGVFAGAEVTGNPVRAEIAVLARESRVHVQSDSSLKLLVLGGSQGARALNETVPQALSLLSADVRPHVFHQAGGNLLEETRAAYAACGVDAQVEAFVEDMAARYRWADVAVCRSGAMTVSELACAGVPAVLVPFPFAIDDHQTANARWLADAGAARLLPQTALTPATLAGMLREFSAQRMTLHAMADRLSHMANPAAAERVAEICEEVSRA